MSITPNQIRDALVASGIATAPQADAFLGAIWPSERPTCGPKETLIVWTAGHCLRDPGGPGGWAAVIECPDGRVFEVSGGEMVCTAERAALLAIVGGLLAVTTPARVKVRVTDKPVAALYRNSVPQWREDGWKTADGAGVPNGDVWEAAMGAMEDLPDATIVAAPGGESAARDRALKLAAKVARRQRPHPIRRPGTGQAAAAAAPSPSSAAKAS